MRLKGKGILLIVLSISLAIYSMLALSEASFWNCPECGRNGNTGNYCGGCGHPSPWIQTPTVDKVSVILGPDSSADEMEKQVQLFVEQGQTWTSETAPQTLDSFPLKLDALLQLYNDIVMSPLEIEERDSKYYLNTTISDIVSDYYLGEQIDIYLKYDDHSYSSKKIEPTRIDDHTYAFALPDGDVLGENEAALVQEYSGYSIGPNQWKEGLQIIHCIKNTTENNPNVYINLTDDYNWITFLCGASVPRNRDDENCLSIFFGNSWDAAHILEYDIKNRELVYFD